MQRYKITVEYDGTDFGGFQSQKNARTIQDVLEEALRKLYRRRVKVVGASRTDSGVHAEAQTAHFEAGDRIAPENLLRAINSLLPDDVAVKALERVPRHFHARFSAKRKTYVYRVRLSRIFSPLERRREYVFFYPVSTGKIRSAARLLIGRHDFGSFQAKSGEKEMSTVRTLSRLDVRRRGDQLLFTLEADGFLYNMVRNIVGSLLEVGRGKMTLGEFRAAFQARDRRRMGPTAPPEGLTLVKVDYEGK